MERKLSAAIIGQGRSGRDIHGKYLLTEDAKKITISIIHGICSQFR